MSNGTQKALANDDMEKSEVIPGSPSDRSGFCPGDVVVEFDGSPVQSINETEESYIWFQTADGALLKIEEEMAVQFPAYCDQVLSGVGASESQPICLPQELILAPLQILLEYIRFHQVPGRTDEEHNSYDDEFFKKDPYTLCQLTTAAHHLKLEELTRTLITATGQSIRTCPDLKEREYIYKTLMKRIEREFIEPLTKPVNPLRTRLANKLSSKRNKQPREDVKVQEDSEAQKCEDPRSVDDLVSNINSSDKDSKAAQKSKKKKKNSAKKNKQKNAQPVSASSTEPLSPKVFVQNDEGPNACDGSSQMHALGNESDKDNFISEFDEKTDRELEDFAERMNVSLNELWLFADGENESMTQGQNHD